MNRPRLVLAASVALLFVMAQALWIGTGWYGGLCVSNLGHPSDDDYPMHSWKSYGVPLAFLTVARDTDDCLDVRTTRAFPILPLIIDIASFGAVGVGLHYGLQAWRKLRARG